MNKLRLTVMSMLVVGLLVVAVPAFAQGPDDDTLACREAMAALRDSGETIDLENLPAECDGLAMPFGNTMRGNRPALEEFASEVCLADLAALEDAGEVLNRDTMPETCAADIEAQMEANRPEFSEACEDALAELREAGERPMTGDVPEACAEDFETLDGGFGMRGGRGSSGQRGAGRPGQINGQEVPPQPAA